VYATAAEAEFVAAARDGNGIVTELPERVGPLSTRHESNEGSNLSDASEHPGQNSSAGYLYLLVNPAMEGLVKVGMTARNPRDRARELGAVTGVPTPFILVFDIFVNDCSNAERFVHDELGKMNCRVSANREFFRVEPNEAVRLMLEAKRLFGQS
jgi:hypothetical protein